MFFRREHSNENNTHFQIIIAVAFYIRFERRQLERIKCSAYAVQRYYPLFGLAKALKRLLRISLRVPCFVLPSFILPLFLRPGTDLQLYFCVSMCTYSVNKQFFGLKFIFLKFNCCAFFYSRQEKLYFYTSYENSYESNWQIFGFPSATSNPISYSLLRY